jgi:hypothetical protein
MQSVKIYQVILEQLLHDGVVKVGDEDVARPVHRHADRNAEPGADGDDGAVGLDLLHRVVAKVGDEDVAGTVYRDTERVAEPGADGGGDSGRKRGGRGVLELGRRRRAVGVDRGFERRTAHRDRLGGVGDDHWRSSAQQDSRFQTFERPIREATPPTPTARPRQSLRRVFHER